MRITQQELASLPVIYEGLNSRIYLQATSAYGKPVVIKVLQHEAPTPQQAAQFTNEYELTKDLAIAGIRKAYAKIMLDRRHALVLAYAPDKPLKEVCVHQRRSLAESLRVAVAIAQTLNALHQARIIHKDINSQNILVNPESLSPTIIDFGIASQVDLKTPHLGNPELLEGTLAYISPEQTGRMNRVVDARTDLYSFGVVVYEMLTGRLPFESTDPLELVYCHIARQPTPVCIVNPEIPPIVSEIVMKLLAKDADARYQSAYGVQVDFETCLQQLAATGAIEPFELARHDISGRFRLPQKLYGREVELQTLLAGFERVSTRGTPEVLLVAGYSGVGKSSLVHEIHKPITAKRGLFIAGKFDQFQRNVPYYALRQAFNQFVGLLLTESPARLDQWRNQLLKAVGNNGRLITDLVPRMELAIGPQPEVAEVGPQEAQNRFNMVMQNFMAAIARPDHPLVLFLDDLQWADAASLNLLKMLLTDPQQRNLLVIAAYRDNEVDASHPFSLTVENLKDAGVVVNMIQVGNLQKSDVTALIADTLNLTANVEALSDLVYEKTDGNAFFTNQFLQTLYEEDLLRFDEDARRWVWDIAHIREKGITDNAAEMMERKIRKLQPQTQQVLQLAACIGNTFGLFLLARVYNHSEQETLAHLWEAIEEKLIAPVDEQYKFVALQTGQKGEEPELLGYENRGEPGIKDIRVYFTFIHDRVQHGAYVLIDEAQREKTHLTIGRLLLHQTSEAELEERVFTIVQQLNAGHKLITDADERLELAELNLQAGRKANASAAYQAAVGFLKQGAELLPDNPWDTAYETTLDLYAEWAEAEYLAAHFDEAERLFELAIEKVRTPLDRVRLYETKILILTAHTRYAEVVRVGCEALRGLGFVFPKQPGQFDAIKALLLTRLQLGRRKPVELAELPAMTDPETKAAMRIMHHILAPSTFSMPEMFPLLDTKMVQLSLRRGSSGDAAAGYVSYGLLLCGALEAFEPGYAFGQLAFTTLERFNAREVQGFVNCVFGLMIAPWKTHLREAREYFLPGYQYCLETGDLVWAPYNINMHILFSLLMGEPLESVERAFVEFRPAMVRIGHEDAIIYFNLFKQAALTLQGKSADPARLVGEDYDEDEILPILTRDKAHIQIFELYFWKFMILYILGRYAEALDALRQAKGSIGSVMGRPEIPVYRLFSALTMAALCSDASSGEQKGYLKEIRAHQKKMKKYAASAPMNYLHKYYLISAELARIEGHSEEAMRLYDQAIAGAHENGFIHEEAIANECAAKFYLAQGREKIAGVYLQDARACYRQWGCAPKVKLLETQYPQWLRRAGSEAVSQRVTEVATTTMTASTTVAMLDVTTLVKASQALSQEVRVEQVLERLMQLVLENAGATKGVFVQTSEETLVIQAQGAADQAQIETMLALPLIPTPDASHAEHVPLSVVQYVARTRQPLILNDVAREQMYATDPYILAHAPKSLLCLPIQHQQKLVAVLYLENTLTTDAFTPARVELLNVLSAQAAISMEIARQIENLAEQERLKREMELARQIQTAILPRKITHAELEIEAVMLPAEEVGGDYYDILYGKDGCLWLGIGDVSGHGVTPGLIMLMAQTVHATIATQFLLSPKDVVNLVNAMLYHNVHERLHTDHFMTFTSLKYLGQGVFEYAGAHLDLVVYRQTTGACERLETPGVFLNFIPNIAHATTNTTFTLEIGDILVLYTDGLTEARNPEKNMLDIHQFMTIVQMHATKATAAMREAILQDVLTWCAHQRNDDMTLVVVRRIR